jgi:hypothetical protein
VGGEYELRALLDACVLFPISVRDKRLNVGFYRLVWTEEFLAETSRYIDSTPALPSRISTTPANPRHTDDQARDRATRSGLAAIGRHARAACRRAVRTQLALDARKRGRA